MNALLIVVILVIVALIVGFIIALTKNSARACIALFVLAILLAVGLTCTTFLKPQMSTWYIGYFSGNTMQIRNQATGEDLTLNLAKIPHINYQYKAEQEVQLTRSVLGEPIFVSPKLWTAMPMN